MLNETTLFVMLKTGETSTPTRFLNLARISHIEIHPSGESTAYFGDQDSVRLGVEPTKSLQQIVLNRTIA